MKPKLFMKNSKIDQPLAQVMKKKREKIIITQIRKAEVTSSKILPLLER